MNTRIKRASAILVVLLPLCVYLLVSGKNHRAQPAHNEPVGAAPSLSFSFPVGQVRVYSLDWKRDDETLLPLGGNSGNNARFSAELVGEMTLSGLGQTNGHTLVGLSFPRFDKGRVELLGEVLIDSPATANSMLAGQMAYLEVDRRGRAQVIRFDDGATDLFRHLTNSIAAEIDLELPDGLSRWSDTGPGSFGKAEVAFAWDDGHLSRQRLSYIGATASSLVSRGDIEVEADGMLKRLSASEEASLAGTSPRSGKVTTELRFLRSESFSPNASADVIAQATRPQALGVVKAGNTVESKLLEQRIAGLSHDQLLGDLKDFARVGAMPDEQRWLWRATGLLRRDPELAAEIPRLFDQPDFSAHARSFALDVLVLAGTDQAQHAVASVLGRSEVKADDELYADAMQRLAAVKQPSAESVATVEAAISAPGRRGLAATYTLGALANSLAQNGQNETSARLVAELSQGLDKAKDDEHRIVQLGALGNAGVDSEVVHVAAFKKDPSPLVRAATARALRKTPNDVARSTLHELSGDTDGHVQRAALTSMTQYSLDQHDLSLLSSKMQSGTLVRANDAVVLALAARDPQSSTAQGILKTITARNPDDAELRARARRLLEVQ